MYFPECIIISVCLVQCTYTWSLFLHVLYSVHTHGFHRPEKLKISLDFFFHNLVGTLCIVYPQISHKQNPQKSVWVLFLLLILIWSQNDSVHYISLGTQVLWRACPIWMTWWCWLIMDLSEGPGGNTPILESEWDV